MNACPAMTGTPPEVRGPGTEKKGSNHGREILRSAHGIVHIRALAAHRGAGAPRHGSRRSARAGPACRCRRGAVQHLHPHVRRVSDLRTRHVLQDRVRQEALHERHVQAEGRGHAVQHRDLPERALHSATSDTSDTSLSVCWAPGALCGRRGLLHEYDGRRLRYQHASRRWCLQA
jgi:hypothetical protein